MAYSNANKIILFIVQMFNHQVANIAIKMETLHILILYFETNYIKILQI